MKRLLLTLLVLVMLTPSLVCSGILCSKMAMADMPCCPKQHKETGVKFFKDCSGIELQGVADHIVLNKQVFHSHDLFVLADATRLTPVAAVNNYAIRAPPPEFSVSSSFPPVYLSTQRLRI